MVWSQLDLKITLFNVVALFSLLPTFKLIRLLFRTVPNEERNLFYFVGPFFSKRSIQACEAASSVLIHKHLRRAAMCGAAVVAWFCFFGYLRDHFHLSWIWLSYASAPLLYVWSEGNGALIQAGCGYAFGKIPGPLHHRPLAAKSISQFWGEGWNLWVSDFFRTFVFLPLRKTPHLALGAVFLLSGMIHEVVINFPFYVFANQSLFGSQIAYFAIQLVGVWIDRNLLRTFPIMRVAFLWGVVILPAPLILNEGLLHTIHVI